MSYVAANGQDLIITSLETITCFDPATGDYLFTLDELQGATIAMTEDSTNVTGRNGRILSRIKRNKGVTITGTNGLISGGLLARQLGDNFVHGSTYIMWSDYITVSANPEENQTKYKAVGTEGSEIEHLFVKGNDETIQLEMTQVQTPTSSGQFSYNPATKVITFYPGDVRIGSEVVVMYKRRIIADVLKNSSGKSSGKGQIYIDAFAEDKCGKIYRIQFFFPKVSFSGEFTIDFGSNQIVHEFQATAEQSACYGGRHYFTYTVFCDDIDEESILVKFVTQDRNIFTSGDNEYFTTRG